MESHLSCHLTPYDAHRFIMTAECWLDYASQALHEYILQPSVTCTLYKLCTAPLPSVMEIIQLCAETDLNCTTLKLYSGSSSMYKLLPLTNVVTKVVFSYVSVRQFVQRGPHVIITHDALNLTVQPPPNSDMRHGTPPQSCPLDMQPPWPPTTDIWWSSLETCSNLFIAPPLERHLEVASKARTVCRWAAPFLLECILVFTKY